MATDAEIIDLLQVLGETYGKVITVSQIKVYCESLSNVPAGLLEQAVNRWIAGEAPAGPDGRRPGVFFPRPVELRALAERIANVRPGGSFEGYVDPAQLAAENRDLAAALAPGRELAARRLEMEQRFYQSRELDEAGWQDLIREFEQTGRLEGAAHTQQKLARLGEIAQAEAAIPADGWPGPKSNPTPTARKEPDHDTQHPIRSL